MYYIADTHSFLWYLAASPKLSQKAGSVFESCDRGEGIIVVPAIVLLECVDILDKKKVLLQFEEIIAKLTQASNFIIAEINWSVILETSRVKEPFDIHDRVIVATARLFDASIISRDRAIQKFYPKSIW